MLLKMPSSLFLSYWKFFDCMVTAPTPVWGPSVQFFLKNIKLIQIDFSTNQTTGLYPSCNNKLTKKTKNLPFLTRIKFLCPLAVQRLYSKLEKSSITPPPPPQKKPHSITKDLKFDMNLWCTRYQNYNYTFNYWTLS